MGILCKIRAALCALDAEVTALEDYFYTPFISAPEGAYPGAVLLVERGFSPYMFIVNGVETGEWFVSPGVIPNTVNDGDTIRVRDAAGRLSNILIVELITLRDLSGAPFRDLSSHVTYPLPV